VQIGLIKFAVSPVPAGNWDPLETAEKQRRWSRRIAAKLLRGRRSSIKFGIATDISWFLRDFQGIGKGEAGPAGPRTLEVAMEKEISPCHL